MKQNIVILFLAISLIVSGYINYNNVKMGRQNTENLVTKYTAYITHVEILESGLKGDSPLYHYLEIVGKAEAIGELLQVHYREDGYSDVFTDVPNDLRLLFTRAYESQNRDNEIKQLIEMHRIIAKHLNSEVIKNPQQYHYAYISAQSEIRDKKLIDEETMASFLGW